MMNYIRHLNGVLRKFAGDRRANPTHISLYMALFQYWNIHRFPDFFFVDRAEIMAWSKIGSKATYHRCLHALDSWNYLLYLPSHNPYKGSQIKMLIFDTTSEQALDKHGTSDGQVSVPKIKHNKHHKTDINGPRPKNLKEALDFFEKKEGSPYEAKRFFMHYSAIGWKMGKAPIQDWQAAAENWMLKADAQQHPDPMTKRGPMSLTLAHPDYLITQNDKDYDQPL
nr:hypothetical protein [Allomuricauda oceani]